MKRSIALALVFTMLCALLLAGCGNGQPEIAATPEPEPTPEPTPTVELSLAEAFRDETLTDGVITPEDIAFYYLDENEKSHVDVVKLSEIMDWWNAQETLPRTSTFEQEMPESLQGILPVLDYAFAHSYGRFCIPSTEFTPSDLGVGRSALQMTYLINNSIVSANPSASIRLDDGSTLRFLDVKFLGMETQGSMSQYKEAIDAAREIVAGIPEGSGDYEKIMYLYKWLADNVIYYDGSDDATDYYRSEWNLLYDTMVKKETVCAGYAEGLYVMANLAGVDCLPVWGNIYSGGEWGGHIWNAARVDGDYYLFDSTWDAGLPVERYCFFGVSEQTMQEFYPRLPYGPSKDACPPCEKDLTIEGAIMPPEELAPGEIGEGTYSQPYMDFELSWNGKWTAMTREEINKEYYGRDVVCFDKILRMDIEFLDLMLTRGDDALEVILHLSPITTALGTVCDSPESYMDGLETSLKTRLQDAVVKTERFEKEIDGRTFQCLTVTLNMDGERTTETFLCIQNDGVFLAVLVTSPTERGCENVIRELLG